MKIILTATSPNIDSNVDPRFGRAAYLVIMDTETNEWKAHNNPGVGAPGGAGIQVAQFVADQQAEAVLSGDFGPNACDALRSAGIRMYVYGDCHTIREAVERFKAGWLQQIETPTRDNSHGGFHEQKR